MIADVVPVRTATAPVRRGSIPRAAGVYTPWKNHVRGTFVPRSWFFRFTFVVFSYHVRGFPMGTPAVRSGGDRGRAVGVGERADRAWETSVSRTWRTSVGVGRGAERCDWHGVAGGLSGGWERRARKSPLAVPGRDGERLQGGGGRGNGAGLKPYFLMNLCVTTWPLATTRNR